MRASHTPLFLIGAELFTPVPPSLSLQNTEFSPYSRFPCLRQHTSGMPENPELFLPSRNLKHPQHSVNNLERSREITNFHHVVKVAQATHTAEFKGGGNIASYKQFIFKSLHMQIKSKRPNGSNLFIINAENFRIQFTAVFFPCLPASSPVLPAIFS